MSEFSLFEIVQIVRQEVAKSQIGNVKKITGPAGEKGTTGEPGGPGIQGPRGDKGPAGPVGPQGNQGKKGDKGVSGDDGTDGVGVARIEQDLDDSIIMHMTDGNSYVIEMPILDKQGNPTEVHYKAAGGGGGGGMVDLSKYVKRPTDTHGGKWLVYREPDGTNQGEWSPATTDLIETNGQLMFRDIKGRFAPTPEELDELTNQLKVNRFIWDKIQELDLKAGGVAISDTPPEDPENGMFWFDNSEDVMQLFIWHKDSDAWIPVAPPTTLEGRVSQGEATQSAIIAQIEKSLEEQENIKRKITALEGVVGEHSLIFTADQQNPRAGQFNLKDQTYQLVNSISDARYITLNETDRNDNLIDLSRIVVGDVLRLSDISAQTAELKVIAIAAENVYEFEYLSGELDRLSEYPYDFFLLSSFDPAGLATINYVDSKAKKNKEDIDALQLDVGYRMHATWKYVGDSIQAENLANGEFTIRTDSGGNPILRIYLAGRDTHGRKWYAWSDNESQYTHAFGEHYCSISDSDGEVRKGGKLTEGIFNNSSNQYARLRCEYYKSNFAFTVGNYYTINAAGLLPHAHYIDHYGSNKAPRMIAQASIKEEENANVVIGLPMECEE